MDLPVNLERALRAGCPSELPGPLQTGGSFSGPQAFTKASAIDSVSAGSASSAAPPAVSGIAVMFEVTTGQPQAIASKIGSPKVSLNDG